MQVFVFDLLPYQENVEHLKVDGELPHPLEKRLGQWSDAEIKRAITQGISRDGRKLNPPMEYSDYAKATAEDLDAIVAYLRTIKPLEMQ